ncbi:sugar phosphate isomerase/epimerase family protein [Chryseolinea lacunae]|uniref:Sugar phosphate isomerase/epimerase n=1 Tax=Chryseolinea lacunae TaxID=2801331 RepID=A0ABS1L041_9BACT|nr:sugar phosphate isomerase/epimerase [Chryseolinea lacunae]MBL0743946.1 sugar phosphate isomerase/epimerase [Chryseolinea lacunae]
MKKHIPLALFVLGLFALAPEVVAQTNKNALYTAPFGVQAYTFRRSFPNGVEATLDSIKMMGFTEIEGGGGKMPPEEFKKLCNERGITIPSTGAGYEELVTDAAGAAAKAKALGAKYLMCAWIPHEKGNFTLDNAKKAVADFNAAGKILKENGITFCYHIHGYEFQPYEKGTLLDYIIANTNPQYVSFEMDVLWTHFGGGNPVALLKKYGNRWKLMHMKDLRKGTPKDLTGGTSTENDVALGTGEIDIPGIIREANKIGIKHFFIEDESSHVNEQVPQSIAYLKSLKK